jgi:hypothetical protein
MSASTFDADTQERKRNLDIKWTDKDGRFNNTRTYGQIRGRGDEALRQEMGV